MFVRSLAHIQVLSRSSSHHQLLASRSLPYHMRAAHRSQAAAAALLAGDDSESDYDASADLLATPYKMGVGLGSRGRHASGLHYKGVTPVAAYYDPKAAEFNQYLLEQQEFGNGGSVTNELLQTGATSSGGGGGRASSDDDNDYFGLGTSGLVRSRSCMLGPNNQGGGSSSGPGLGVGVGSSKQASKFTPQGGPSGGSGVKKGAGSGADRSGAKMGSSNWESGGRNTIA